MEVLGWFGEQLNRDLVEKIFICCISRCRVTIKTFKCLHGPAVPGHHFLHAVTNEDLAGP